MLNHKLNCMCLQNEHGQWPLYVAASHGHLEMVRDLERVRCTACTGCVMLKDLCTFTMSVRIITVTSCACLFAINALSTVMSNCGNRVSCVVSHSPLCISPLPLSSILLHHLLIPCSHTERRPCPLPELTE